MLNATVHEHDVQAQVHACLRFFAERYYGDHSLDQDGFNKIDAAFGRELAKTKRLTLAQVIVGARMIRKSHRQLEAGGLHTPMPKEVDAYNEGGGRDTYLTQCIARTQPAMTLPA